MSSLTDDLADLFNETAYAVPGTFNGYGDWVPSGTLITLPCRIEGATAFVRDSQGREVVSHVQIYVGGYFNLAPNTHTFTLPSRFIPSSQLVAVRVDKAYDEEGPCYETVWLP